MNETRAPNLVSLKRHDNYEPGAVLDAVRELLAPLGGIEKFVKPGDRVLLKPNLVMGFPPERAITTHPSIVKAVAKLALDAGGKVSIGDSPGIGSCKAAAEKAGLGTIARELEVKIVEFTRAEVVPVGQYRQLRIAKEVIDADVVINLPKMKTHGQMLMTMAVKNLFGTVVGVEKFQWHYRAGHSRDTFSDMIYEVSAAANPQLTIVDAIVSMDGTGPTSGEPNPTGFLASGTDLCSIDAILMDIVGLEREKLYTLQAAIRHGNTVWHNATAVGDDISLLKPERWNLPQTQPIKLVGHPIIAKIGFLNRFIERQVTALPYAMQDKCILCKKCVNICPAGAMSVVDDKITVDYDKCIKCYCCHELCPEDAIGLKKSWLRRLIGRLV